MFFPQIGETRIVGRIAFPLFCFLLVQGFRHTRSLPKYALRLALFALLSEGRYNLVFSGKFTVLSAHNVFYSLLLALGALAAWKHFLPKWPLGALLGLLAACALTAGMLRKRWAYAVGWVIQFAAIALGFVIGMMFVLGVIFLVLWWGAVGLGTKIERERAAAYAEYDRLRAGD